jgi:hypothetical protein
VGWLNQSTAAVPFARAARVLAGVDPDAESLRAAVLQVAQQQHIALTEPETALQRALMAANVAEAAFRDCR